MRRINFFAVLVFLVIVAVGAGLSYASYLISENPYGSTWIALVALLAAILVAAAIKVADQWEKAVILRLGRFQQVGAIVHDPHSATHDGKEQYAYEGGNDSHSGAP